MKQYHLQRHGWIRDRHTEWSKSKTNITWYCLYVESKKKKKKDTDEFIYKTKKKTTATENKVMVTKGRAGRGQIRVWG